MSTLANGEDSDEIPHNAAFHQGLHYLLRQKRSRNTFYLEIVTLDPSIYTMDHPKSIVSSKK